MTALVKTADQILNDIARDDVDFAVARYAHARVAGTHYGYNWHLANGIDACNDCRTAERLYRRNRDRSPEFLRLLALGVNRATAAYLANALGTRARFSSTVVDTAVHSASIVSAA